MLKQIKVSILVLILTSGISVQGFAKDAATLEQLQKNVENLSKELAKSLPLNSSLGLNWSDAYIGKLVPGVPPHFGIGLSVGVTTMDIKVIEDLMESFGYSIPFDYNKMILPAYAGEARLGGIFLPFDIGVKFGYIPSIGIGGDSISFDYLLAGGDVRVKLLDLKIFKLSAGMGVNYLRGSITGKVNSAQTIEYEYKSNPYSIIIHNPEAQLQWKTTSLDFKVQGSFPFRFITPYIGLAGGYAWSSAGYKINAPVEHGGGGSMQLAEEYLDSLDLEKIDISNKGMSSIIKKNAFSFRTFGGLSFNLAVFRIDLTGLYSFRDQNYGASLGFRFQL